MRRRRIFPALTLVTALSLPLASTAQADQVVQVPLTTFMTARAVTTLTGGKLVPWTMGIDGGGTADGYMTAAASKFHNDPASLKALPDDGKFAADARHPEVQLHFSNDADATSQQTYWVKGMGNFTFAIPPATYSKMFLFLTSSEGGSTLKVSLTYADATTDTSNVNLPDYYADVSATDMVLFNLAADLPKWTKTNAVAEMNHHNLTGVEIHPAAARTLSSIKIEKAAAGYLVFWGATGIATSAVDLGTDAGLGGASVEAGTGVDAAGTGVGGSGGNTIGGAGVGGASGSGGPGDVAGSVGRAGAIGGDDASPVAASDSGCSCSAARREAAGPPTSYLWLALGFALCRLRGARGIASA